MELIDMGGGGGVSLREDHDSVFVLSTLKWWEQIDLKSRDCDDRGDWSACVYRKSWQHFLLFGRINLYGEHN